MGAEPVVHVLLELEFGEPISGTISGPRGAAEPFRGWLELTSRLEQARAAQDPGAIAEGGEEPSCGGGT